MRKHGTLLKLSESLFCYTKSTLPLTEAGTENLPKKLNFSIY